MVTAEDRRAALLRIRGQRQDLAALVRRVEQHADQHLGYIAFSGGKDSTVVAHLARTTGLPLVWFDSGLEFPETRAYVTDFADRWGLDLHVERPARTALDLLVSSGWWDHQASGDAARLSVMRDVLIEHPAELAHAEFGGGELWGIRAEESPGRRKSLLTALRRETRSCGCCSDPAGQRARHGGVIRRRSGQTAFSPVWDWSAGDIFGYLSAHDVPVNPVYDRFRRIGAPVEMHRVSLLIDGSALAIGRAVWLRRGWPDLFEQLAEALPRLREFG